MKRRSPNIQYLILAACGSGKAMEAWKKACGPQCLFQGWVNITTTSETKDFTTDSIGDGLFSHHGTDTGRELDDYIKRASSARPAKK